MVQPSHLEHGPFNTDLLFTIAKNLQAHNGSLWNKEKYLDFFNVRNYDNRRYHNLLLHVPHSSTSFPVESKVSFNDLDDEERLLIDYYTDELFIPQIKQGK